LLYNYALVDAYYETRDYQRTIEQANKALEIDPKYARAVAYIGSAYEQMGSYKQAMEQCIRVGQLEGDEARAQELRQVFEKAGYKGYLRKNAKDAEAEGEYFGAAEKYAMLGEKDAAFAALEQAAAAGNHVDEIKLDPALDNLRSDSRYADLQRRMGLPQ
jgi:tetratricopeptide (TPR) repeat protein